MKSRFVISLILVMLALAVTIPASVMAKEHATTPTEQRANPQSCEEVICGDWYCIDAWKECECPNIFCIFCGLSDIYAFCERRCVDVDTGEFCWYQQDLTYYPNPYPSCPDPLTICSKFPCSEEQFDESCQDYYCCFCP